MSRAFPAARRSMASRAARGSCTSWSASSARTAASCCTPWAAWARPRSPPRPRTGGRAAACFRDGACFVSFEQFASADRVVQVLGDLPRGPRFERCPAVEQRRRAIECVQQKDVLMVWDNFESVLPHVQRRHRAPDGAPYTDDERDAPRRALPRSHDGAGRGRLLVTCRPGDERPACPAPSGSSSTAWPGPTACGCSRASRSATRHLAIPGSPTGTLDPLLSDLADHPLSLELVGPHLKSLTPEAIRADFGRLLARVQAEAAGRTATHPCSPPWSSPAAT